MRTHAPDKKQSQATSPPTSARLSQPTPGLGNQAVQRLLRAQISPVPQGRELIQRQVAAAPAPPAPVPAARPAYRHAWENPALLDTIYPARETMLRRFVAMYREIELRALAEDERGAILERVRREIQAEIARLQALPAPTRSERTRITELQQVLRRAMGRAQQAWETAVSWDSRHRGDSLQGEPLLAEVRRLFGTGHVPEWLQPMVLQYAGMRYASAHGSYYSPVRLVYLIEDARGIYARERAERDAAAAAAGAGGGGRQRRRRPSRGPTTTETATLGLDPEAAAQRLVAMREAGEIPDWAWHQIVRDTELRVQHAGAGWEASSDPPAGAEPAQSAFWQNILRRWRGSERIGNTGVGVTGWRSELLRRAALVTTRMVCNELAEAAARQRGIRLPGGIRADADYYTQQETAGARPDAAPEVAGSYFRNPRDADDFIPGAGLFFVKGIWQTAEPGSHARVIAVAGLTYPNIMTAEESTRRTGYERERRRWESRPEATRGAEPVDPFAGRSETLPSDGQVVDGWTYHVTPGQAIHRTRGAETQWMAWSHEATVVHRIGSRVFTLETTDAGGGSEGGSTGGASGFRVRQVNDLLRPGVFVGYIPGTEGAARAAAAQPSPEAAPPPGPEPSPSQLTPAESEALDVGRSAPRQP